MRTLYCAGCDAERPVEDFCPSKRHKRGYEHRCRPCGNAYRRERYATVESYRAGRIQAVNNTDRSITAIIRAAKDVPCTDCGERYHYCVMDFDHRDPTQKSFTIASRKGKLSDIAAEIAKCDVVCSNCHRMRTWGPKMDLTDKSTFLS